MKPKIGVIINKPLRESLFDEVAWRRLHGTVEGRAAEGVGPIFVDFIYNSIGTNIIRIVIFIKYHKINFMKINKHQHGPFGLFSRSAHGKNISPRSRRPPPSAARKWWENPSNTKPPPEPPSSPCGTHCE
jgi:hypothetical protein